MVLVPVGVSGRIPCFLDLDTGRGSVLPTRFTTLSPTGPSLTNDVLDWARAQGFDLYATAKRVQDREHCVLRTIETEAFAIASRPKRGRFSLQTIKLHGGLNFNKLAHRDPATKQLDYAANAEFMFITREGTVGTLDIGVELEFDEDGRLVSIEQDLFRHESAGHLIGRRFEMAFLVPVDNED